MGRRYTLNRSAASIARTHGDGLQTLYCELSEPFKLQEATEVIDEWDQGTFQKLQHAGLVENTDAGYDEPKDWYLAQQTKRWLKQQCAAD